MTGVHLSAWQPGLVGLVSKTVALAPAVVSEAALLGRQEKGSRQAVAPGRGGNQMSRWERLSWRSHELSVELSLSLLNQRGTKTEPDPKQQDHCPLADIAAFWVCHAG